MIYTVSTHILTLGKSIANRILTECVRIREGRLSCLNNNWKDAWVIFKRDIRLDRLYLIWNVIFMVYLAVAISVFTDSSGKAGVFMNPMADFMLLTLLPVTGFYFSRRSFSYIKEDSYTRMLQYYRTLPIQLITILRGRFIQLFTAMLFNGIVFYPALYLFTGIAGDGPLGHIDELLALALTWSGYALLINGIFIYFEFLSEGRRYFWIGSLVMLIAGAMAFLVHWLDGSMLAFTLEQSRRYSLLSPSMWGSLVLGGASLAIFSKITLSKLGRRDLI